jgi:hypothetical protein
MAASAAVRRVARGIVAAVAAHGQQPRPEDASFSAARVRRLGSGHGVESIDAGQSARAGKSQSISQLFPSDAPESDEARHGAAGMMRVL